jgi:ring-1,2-phenylacetyl-CoA epoxidase subunit PaaE
VGDADLRRTYSVCSSAAGGPLRVAVKRLDGGAFSTWVLDGLQPGRRARGAAAGRALRPDVDPTRTRTYGLIAAGSGITPVLSIAWTVLDVEPQSQVVLVYGNRTSGDVMFLEELADLKDRFPERLQVLHVLSREEQESELLSGRIDRPRLERLLATLLPVGASTSGTCAGRSAWSPTAARRCSTRASPARGCTSSSSTPTPRRRGSAPSSRGSPDLPR